MVNEKFSGPFPRAGEDDLYSFPEPDLRLALKTKPYNFPFWKMAFNEHKCAQTVRTRLLSLPYSN